MKIVCKADKIVAKIQQLRKELQQRADEIEEREALREHAEAHYGEHHMTKLDWVKAILGGVCTALFFWAFTAFVFLL